MDQMEKSILNKIMKKCSKNHQSKHSNLGTLGTTFVLFFSLQISEAILFHNNIINHLSAFYSHMCKVSRFVVVIN